MDFDDNHVKQDGLPTARRISEVDDPDPYIPHPVTGVITQLYHVDNAQNRDGETILCDIHCQQVGWDLFRVPWLEGLGSADNYDHEVPKAFTKNLDGTKFNAQRINPKIGDGDTVVVCFINGNPHQPEILKVLPHNQAGHKGLSPSPRPVTADGVCSKKRRNGTDIIIDKNGNILVDNTNTLDKDIQKKKKITIDLNAKKDDGTRETQQVKIEIDNSGNGLLRFTTTNAAGKSQIMTYDANAKSMTMTNQHANGANSVALSESGIALNIVQGNLTMTVDGDTTIATKKATVNASDDVVVNGKKVTVNATDEVAITSTAKVVVGGDGGTDLGKSSSETNVIGSVVKLNNGALPVAKVTSQGVGIGNLGGPVLITILDGSPTVLTV